MEFENRWNTLSAASTGEMPVAREMSSMEQELRSWDSSLDALGKVIERLNSVCYPFSRMQVRGRIAPHQIVLPRRLFH